MRIELTHNEWTAILSTVEYWHRKQLTQEVFRGIQHKSGIPARLVEITFWHLDTLGILSDCNWLVFKGGTCVQTYLPSGFQRASVDLDFNSIIENPNTIKDEIQNLNKRIQKRGGQANIAGIMFGTFEFKGDDPHSGTLNFGRRMPSRFGELEKVGDNRIQAKSIRVQINYKHSWLPAMQTIMKAPEFFILDYQHPKKKVTFNHSSLEDLIVDKILATTVTNTFGRERFKDVYDLGMLLKNDFDTTQILKKLELVCRRSHLEQGAVVRGSIETIYSFSTRSQEVMGFAAMVGLQGRETIRDWDDFCFSIAEKLKILGEL